LDDFNKLREVFLCFALNFLYLLGRKEATLILTPLVSIL